MAKLIHTIKDNKKRCEWCLKDDIYVAYHDDEWGEVSHDDAHLFEHLILETFQAGLSWHTILKKREHFREAFSGFNPELMAGIGSEELNALLNNANIIRSRAKIEAAVNNAKLYLEIKAKYGSFDKYIWQFTDYETLHLKVDTREDIQTTIPESDRMAKDMKQRGFKFVGSTTCMAYMEAVGMVSDHFTYCWKSKSK